MIPFLVGFAFGAVIAVTGGLYYLTRNYILTKKPVILPPPQPPAVK